MTREPERAPWGPRAGEEPEASPSPAPGEGRKDVEEMVREPEAQGLSKEDIAYQLMQEHYNMRDILRATHVSLRTLKGVKGGGETAEAKPNADEAVIAAAEAKALEEMKQWTGKELQELLALGSWSTAWGSVSAPRAAASPPGLRRARPELLRFMVQRGRGALRARRAHGDGDFNYDAVCCELKPAAEAKDAARLLKVMVQMDLLRGMEILREGGGSTRDALEILKMLALMSAGGKDEVDLREMLTYVSAMRALGGEKSSDRRDLMAILVPLLQGNRGREIDPLALLDMMEEVECGAREEGARGGAPGKEAPAGGGLGVRRGGRAPGGRAPQGGARGGGAPWGAGGGRGRDGAARAAAGAAPRSGHGAWNIYTGKLSSPPGYHPRSGCRSGASDQLEGCAGPLSTDHRTIVQKRYKYSRISRAEDENR